MALMLALLAGLVLGMLGHLVLAWLGLSVSLALVLLMVLVLRCRRRLGSGRQSEDERNRGNDDLHLNSPEAFDRMNESKVQASRGGGGSDSGWRPKRKVAKAIGDIWAAAIGCVATVPSALGTAEQAMVQSIPEAG